MFFFPLLFGCCCCCRAAGTATPFIAIYPLVCVCCVAFWARRLYTYSFSFCWPVYLGLKRICCVCTFPATGLHGAGTFFFFFFFFFFPFSPLVDLLILCRHFHKSQVFFFFLPACRFIVVLFDLSGRNCARIIITAKGYVTAPFRGPESLPKNLARLVQ